MFGAANGLGRLITTSGEIYDGSFRDQKYHGFGELNNSCGTYKGMFRNGKQKGFGILTTNQGESILGEWSGETLIQKIIIGDYVYQQWIQKDVENLALKIEPGSLFCNPAFLDENK